MLNRTAKISYFNLANIVSLIVHASHTVLDHTHVYLVPMTGRELRVGFYVLLFE